MKKNLLIATLASLLLASCATQDASTPDKPDSKAVAAKSDAVTAKAALTMMKASFKARGQAEVDRLDQDETQSTCSQYEDNPPKAVAQKIEALNQKLIVLPADGKLLGDWKAGERIAQSGVGTQFSDDPKNPAGGNCYACHQLTQAEVSYGNIGPSLFHFGKLRGYTDTMRQYAYGKIYNAQAFSACSNMPRFGHRAILTEAQIKDVVALLMDPASPVNK